MTGSLICPVCKADNAAGPMCRRCKADLAMLFALDEQRLALLSQTRQHFHQGQFEQALHSARAAHDICQGSDSSRWIALLSLAAGRFGEAWQAYRTVAHG